MTVETIVMELVVNGGAARSLALEAVQAALNKDFAEADAKMAQCKGLLQKAHEFQTELLQAEAGGEGKCEVNLLVVHGQDHLMNAITVQDLADKMIQMCKLMYGEEKSV